MKADSNILASGSNNMNPKLMVQLASPVSRCMVETPQAGKNDL
jgi:hypothetical protein